MVDDSALDIELALDAFQEARLLNRVEVVRSGAAAIAYLRGAGEYADRDRHPFPDILLLDLKMPGVDGFEVLRQVKSTPELRRLPVIVLTSSNIEGDRATSYDVGANSYIVKPVSFGAFVSVVRTIRDYWFGINVGPPRPGS